MRFKKQDVDNEYFYQLPKSLFTYKKYQGLSPQAKIIYAILKDRMKVSMRNGWAEENGDVYLKFSYENMGKLLGISQSTVSREFKDLKKYGLIETVHIPGKSSQKIYINKIEIPASMEEVTDFEAQFEAEERQNQQAEIEAKAQKLMEEAWCQGQEISLEAAKYKVIQGLQNGRENSHLQICKDNLSDMKEGTCKNETIACKFASGTCKNENTLLASVQASKTNLSSNTELVRLNKENTTTTTGRAAEADRINEPFQKIVCAYQENISPMVGPVVIKELKKLCEDYGMEQVNDSITEAALSAKGEVNVRYLGAILKRWQKESKVISPKTAEHEGQEEAVFKVPQGDVVYDGDGKPMPDPLPGENAQEYFERVGIF